MAEQDRRAQAGREVEVSGALTFTVLPISCLAVLLAIAAIAFFLGRRLERRSYAVLIAGLALPAAMLLMTIYAIITMEPDDPPPGMVLFGAFGVIAIVTPISLIVSVLSVRLARR